VGGGGKKRILGKILEGSAKIPKKEEQKEKGLDHTRRELKLM